MLDRRGVRVEQVAADALPLIDSRCAGSDARGGKRYCLVEDNKDCRPKSWQRDVQPCDCTQNATSEVKAMHEARFSARKCDKPRTRASKFWRLLCESR